MKLKIKGTLVLLAAVAVIYTACKKSEKAPTPVAVTDPKTDSLALAGSQISLNVAQSLNGSYGGVSISDGIKLPAFATISNVKPTQNQLGALCSFFPDTTVSYTTTLADTLKAQTSGLFKFYASCTNGAVTGYSIYDSLATTGKTAARSFIYNVAQYFVVKGLNAGNTLLSVDGSLKSYVDVTYTNTAVKPVSVHSYYTLTGLTIDLSKNADITGGVATYTSIGSNSEGNWYYKGTITFLGGHKASITVNNKTFTADLTSGKLTLNN